MKSEAWIKLLWAHVSKDETRYRLSGVFADEDGSLVATDGHRMLVVNSGNVGLSDFATLHKGYIFNKAGLRIEGKYPEWRKLLPNIGNGYAKIEWESVPFILKGIKNPRRGKVPGVFIDAKGITSYKTEGSLVSVNAAYLSVYFDMLESGAELWVKNNTSPIVIKDEFAMAVLMPMRM